MKQISIFDSPLEPRNYHVTTDIPAKEQIKKEEKAKGQTEIVRAIYNKHFMLSPSEAYKIFCKENPKPHPPITSIRRSISNLKKAEYLIRTEVLINGLYGDSEHIYKLNS